jgi:ABC-2 type transport system permease protein
VTTTAISRPDADLSTARVLVRTCTAEWTRLWTVRATWLLLAAGALMMVGIAAAAGSGAASDPDAAGDAAWVAAEFTTLPGQFAFLTLALTLVTADYATGGIVPTLQWTTRRTVLLLARTIVAVTVATVAAVLFALAAVLTALLASRGTLELPAAGGDVLATVALVVAAGALLGVGLGFLLRSTAGVLVTVFLLMLVLPIMLPNLPVQWGDDVARRLPGTGAVYLLVGEVDGMTTTSSGTVLLAWAAAALLLGWLRLVRTDANG